MEGERGILTWINVYRNNANAIATKTPAKPAPLVIFIEALPLDDPDGDAAPVVVAPEALFLKASNDLSLDSTVLTANTIPEVQ